MSVVLLDTEADKEATFRLMRLVEWSGETLDHFTQLRVPLTGPPWIGQLPAQTKVIIPMGQDAASVCGIRGGILQTRGYLSPGPPGTHLLPTVHPAFIQHGMSKWSAAFINDVQKACRVDAAGVPPQVLSYTLDPSPAEAYAWAKEYRRTLEADPTTRLAFDIETPGKGDDEEDIDTDSDAPDRTWRIDRIGFSYRALSALSIPWDPIYQAAIRLVLSSPGDKVVWNAGFDVPRIRRATCPIEGLIHDGMVAWHILHTDLPKRLGFVATFTCPWQPAWKHLSGARPAFYNATDADVELRSMESIESELRRSNLWGVYQRDVLDLEPILVHMQREGMPVDPAVRLDRAIKLDTELQQVKQRMEEAVPIEARKIKNVYKKRPKDTSDLLSRPGVGIVNVCPTCGVERPGKPHFKSFKKKINPCAGGEARSREVPIAEFYRLAPFTPSRDQMIRYHTFRKRPFPMVFDKKTRSRKVSFGERQLKILAGHFPNDVLYSLILTYRELDKIGGTYLGRPVLVEGPAI